MTHDPPGESRRDPPAKNTHALTPEPVADNPEQSKRFVEAARELGIEETGAAYDRALDRILPPRKPGEPAPRVAREPKPKEKRARTKDG